MKKIEFYPYEKNILIPAMKEQILLLCVARSKSGLLRKYEAYTVVSGQITRCTPTLGKFAYGYNAKSEKIHVSGCGFSPVPDFASALNISQNVFNEVYL